ncbi:hypothetical protein CARUB_v10002464mg [Capsella rubella]|uniref:Uncharacterized protein n=1 Tax=Capsella rubella TaxID=81985 RepID=R0HAF4_9BRAS|nr:hypothetical protein CARUB_v10002464mg [Capsella rubella]
MVLKPCVVETTIEGDSSKLDEIEEGSDATKVVKIEERNTADDDDMLEPPEWDVDSFDDVEYYSSADPSLSSGEELSSVEVEALKNYNIVKRQVIDSKGFYVDPELRLIYRFKGIKHVSLDRHALWGKNFREYWGEMVCNVEFVEVVRGNYRGGPRAKSYITFMARETPNGPLVEYQAKCMVTLDGITHPILCRPSTTPTKP